MEKELREGLESVRREVGEGVKVGKSESEQKLNCNISFQVLETTERLLEGLKGKLMNGHGEEEKGVNGFRKGVPEERINGLAADRPNGVGVIAVGEARGAVNKSEASVAANGDPRPHPPVATLTQVIIMLEHIVRRQTIINVFIIRQLRERRW